MMLPITTTIRTASKMVAPLMRGGVGAGPNCCNGGMSGVDCGRSTARLAAGVLVGSSFVVI
jgi:hypothetical protein